MNRKAAGMKDGAAPERRPKRDAARSRRAILEAALVEFSELGHAGARIDAIAARAGVSKPMIYAYFGDKDDLYAAALREAYVQIRRGEQDLDLRSKEPVAAIRALVSFTFDHFRAKPWFISMLNTENLRGGDTIRKISDASEIQTSLIDELHGVLKRGVEQGVFREGIDPVGVYITIASLCYFPISNRHTLRAVFHVPLDDAWIQHRKEEVSQLVVRFLYRTEPVSTDA